MPRTASSRFRREGSAALLAIALSGRSHAAWADEPAPPEADTNPAVFPPPSTRPNLVLIGAAVTAGWYGAAYGTSYLWPDSEGAASLRIPVAGPYMALARTGCGPREVGCGAFTLVLRTVFTTLSAVGQTGGVLAMLEGVFVPTADSPGGPPPRERIRPRLSRPAAPAVSLAPLPLGESGIGLGLAGSL